MIATHYTAVFHTGGAHTLIITDTPSISRLMTRSSIRKSYEIKSDRGYGCIYLMLEIEIQEGIITKAFNLVVSN
jgi:hypothetical protein